MARLIDLIKKKPDLSNTDNKTEAKEKEKGKPVKISSGSVDEDFVNLILSKTLQSVSAVVPQSVRDLYTGQSSYTMDAVTDYGQVKVVLTHKPRVMH